MHTTCLLTLVGGQCTTPPITYTPLVTHLPFPIACRDTHPLPHCMLGYTPPAQCMLGYTPPPAQCMLGYGQQAGGTHPTGMHSFCFEFLDTPILSNCGPPYKINLTSSYELLSPGFEENNYGDWRRCGIEVESPPSTQVAMWLKFLWNVLIITRNGVFCLTWMFLPCILQIFIEVNEMSMSAYIGCPFDFITIIDGKLFLPEL